MRPQTIRTMLVGMLGVALTAIAVTAWWSGRTPDVIANPTLPTATFVVGEPPMTSLLKLEVADDAEETRRGLMARDSIGSADGMAFTRPSQPTGFWMHGMRFPLDIVYVGTNDRVHRVVMGRPMDDTVLPAGAPISLVIEVPAGAARLYGLKPGALVRREGDRR